MLLSFTILYLLSRHLAMVSRIKLSLAFYTSQSAWATSVRFSLTSVQQPNNSSFGTVGAPLAGRISDYVVVKYRAQRGGVWYPEDRLRTTLIGAGALVPLSVLFSGLLTQFVPHKWGLIANLVCLFVNGLGVCSIGFFDATCVIQDRSISC